MEKRYVGVDLASKGDHTAQVYDPIKDKHIGKQFKFERNFSGFEKLVRKSRGRENNTDLFFVMEPTGTAWLTLSSYLTQREHSVYVVKTQKAHALREFYKKYKKSDSIDSRSLSKMLVVDSESLRPLSLPDADTNSLKRLCKQRERIVDDIAGAKKRILSFLGYANPTVEKAFGKDFSFSQSQIAFLEKFVDPFKIKRFGIKRLRKFLERHGQKTRDKKLAERIFAASSSAVKIYEKQLEENKIPFDFKGLQEDINREIEIMKFEESKVEEIEKRISEIYNRKSPGKELESICGISETIAAASLGIIGDIGRFPNIVKFKGFLGLVPKKNQSGGKDKKGLGITKEGPGILKKYYYLAANVARQYDVEFAAMYNRLRGRGLHHTQALCALANKIASRVYAVLKRVKEKEEKEKEAKEKEESESESTGKENVKYEFRNLAGEKIDKAEARRIVLERFPSKKERARRSAERSEKKSKELVNPRSCSRQLSNSSRSRINKPAPLKDILKEILCMLE